MDLRDRCLLLRAEEGSPDLVRELEKAGLNYQDASIYRVRSLEDTGGTHRLLSPRIMIFGSGRGVHAFFRQFTLAPETRILCIGPVTARAAWEEGCKHVETARIHSVSGIREALERKEVRE